MKVLFVNPPIRVQEPAKHIPYGLSILAALTDELGHQVAFIDLNAERVGVDGLRQTLKLDRFDVVAIGGLITQYKYIKEILPVIKEKQPQALIVAGGGFFTSMPKWMMKHLPIDVGVIGEGEKTWVEVLDHVDDQRWKRVKGIIYRKRSGKIIRNPPRLLMTEKELDELPYPAWDLLPLNVYFANSKLPLSVEAMTCNRRLDVISERGCPFECIFCTHLGMSQRDINRIYRCNRKGPAIRFQSPEYVVEMIKYMRLKYQVDFISFLDENLTSRPKRCFELCDLLEEEDLVGLIKFGCLGHVATVSYQLLQRLRDVGFTYISYGGESADQRMLDSIKKRQTPEQMQAALDATVKAEMNPIMTFMCMYPDEDIDSILATVNFWIRNQAHIEPFFITPYPATELYEKYKNVILKQYDGDMDAFLLELDDATKLVANLSKNFNDVEALGLRQLMIQHDVKRIKRFADLKGLKYGEKTGS